MSEYNPFERGPSPVGVCSAEWYDADRDRNLPVEIWYPASDAHRGEDLEESNWDRYKPMPLAPEVTQQALRDAAREPGTRALIVFSHGFGGERVTLCSLYHLCSQCRLQRRRQFRLQRRLTRSVTTRRSRTEMQT